MGEVYRAKDPRLAREVAIEILNSALSNDPDRFRVVLVNLRSSANSPTADLTLPGLKA